MIRQVAATPAETADRVHAALQAKAIGDVDVGATLVVAQCAPTLRAPTRGAPGAALHARAQCRHAGIAGQLIELQ
jgi:phage tail sheath gpL-like